MVFIRTMRLIRTVPVDFTATDMDRSHGRILTSHGSHYLYFLLV